MIRRPPRSTLSSSSAASDVYKRRIQDDVLGQWRRAGCFQAQVGRHPPPFVEAGRVHLVVHSLWLEGYLRLGVGGGDGVEPECVGRLGSFLDARVAVAPGAGVDGG